MVRPGKELMEPAAEVDVEAIKAELMAEAIAHAKEAEDVKSKEAATIKLQAAVRGKAQREEETMRKRRSSVGSADL